MSESGAPDSVRHASRQSAQNSIIYLIAPLFAPASDAGSSSPTSSNTQFRPERNPKGTLDWDGALPASA